MKRYVILSFLCAFTVLLTAQTNEYPLLFLKKNYQGILSLATQSINNTGHADDYYWAARACQELGRSPEAVSFLEKGHNLFPGDQEIIGLLSDILFENGRYQDVLALLGPEIIPGTFDLIRKKVLICEFYENYPEAIRILSQALATDTANLFHRMHLADNYAKTGQDSLAVLHYLIIYQQNPGNMLAARKLAMLYLKNTPELAAPLCDSILKKDSLNLLFYRIKARALLKQNKNKEALPMFEKLYSLGDSSYLTMKTIGSLKLDRYEFHEARPFIYSALQMDTSNAELNYMYGYCLLNSMYKQKAIDYFHKCLSILTPDPGMLEIIYKQLAYAHYDLKEYEQCIEVYEKAYKINPANKEYLFSIASVYDHGLGKKDVAYKKYKEFLAALPPADTVQKPEKQPGIDLRTIAEERIRALREDLFFEN